MREAFFNTEIGFSDEQAALLNAAARYVGQAWPMARVRAHIDAGGAHDAAAWQELVELGWSSGALPEHVGGAGLGIGDIVPIAEQLGAHLVPGPLLATTLAGQAILAGAEDTQKAALLGAIAQGALASVALHEADADWTRGAFACAAWSIDGELALSGEKILVLDGEDAEHIAVFVSFEGAPALVLLKRAHLRGAWLREPVMDLTRRSFTLRLDGVRAPREALAPVGLAPAALAATMRSLWLLLAAEACGGAGAVIETTLDYMRTRTQFGLPIGAYQALKHPMVDLYIAYESARSLVYAAAHLADQREVGEAAARMALAQAGEALAAAADRAIQFHGGFGFTWACDAHLYRRRAFWSDAYGGDSAHHRRRLGESLLRQGP